METCIHLNHLVSGHMLPGQENENWAKPGQASLYRKVQVTVQLMGIIILP